MKRIITILLVTIMALSFVSCSGEKTTGLGETTSPATSDGIFRETTKNPYSDEIKIAWIPVNAADANGTAWGKGIERELSYWSNVTFNIFDGEKNAEKQSSIINDLVAQKYDAIIVQPYNSSAVAVAVENAEAAGVPVICINIDAETPHAAIVAMTDYEAGYVIGTKMAESVNNKGNFVVIQATPGATRGESLEEGFQAAMKNYPEIKILDEQSGEWNTEKANSVMNDFLTKYNQIDGVFCHNDQMAEGAATAVQAAGRLGQMVIWGANGETKALQYIEQGLMTGTIYTDCYDQGSTAARLAMMFIGGNIDSSKFTQTLKIKMPPIVVTSENVADITPDKRW